MLWGCARIRSEVQGIRLKAKFPIRLKAEFPKKVSLGWPGVWDRNPPARRTLAEYLGHYYRLVFAYLGRGTCSFVCLSVCLIVCLFAGSLFVYLFVCLLPSSSSEVHGNAECFSVCCCLYHSIIVPVCFCYVSVSVPILVLGVCSFQVVFMFMYAFVLFHFCVSYADAYSLLC